MNPVPLFLIIVTLPLLLVGCEEKEVVEPVQEKVLEVKEEVQPEDSVAETKPNLEGVNFKELDRRGKFPNFIFFIKGSDTPYTGKSFELYDNGQKQWEGNWKDGKEEGLFTWWYRNEKKLMGRHYKNGKKDGLELFWHENGQKKSEGKFKDGKKISVKFWNSKGEPVESFKEANKK